MITEFGIDGFRVDTVKHVNDEFWEASGSRRSRPRRGRGQARLRDVRRGVRRDRRVPLALLDRTRLPGHARLRLRRRRQGVRASRARDRARGLLRATTGTPTTTPTPRPGEVHRQPRRRPASAARSHRQPGRPDAELVARFTLGQALNFLTRGRPVVYYGDEQGFVGDGGDQDARQDMFPSQVASYNDDDLIGTDATTADDNFDTTHPLYGDLADLATLRVRPPGAADRRPDHRSSAGLGRRLRVQPHRRRRAGRVRGGAQQLRGAGHGHVHHRHVRTPPGPRCGPGGGPLTSDAERRRLTVDVPALGVVVYRADTTIDATTPTIDHRRRQPGPRSPAGTGLGRSRGRLRRGHLRRLGRRRDYEVIGTDDNAPYRVYHDVSACRSARRSPTRRSSPTPAATSRPTR
jgi:hypothetical protein